jgi:hypothetical protein
MFTILANEENWRQHFIEPTDFGGVTGGLIWAMQHGPSIFGLVFAMGDICIMTQMKVF